MHLNHPETIPEPWSVEKLSSVKLVPGAKTFGDHCSKQFYQKWNSYFDFQMPESCVSSSFYNSV